MAQLTIPNIFANLEPADADEVNANFTAVATAVNNRYDIGVNDESDVTFTGTGHAHTGGADGKILTGPAVALAIDDSDRGTVLFKTNAGTVNGTSSSAISFGSAFAQFPVLSIYGSYAGSTGTHLLNDEVEINSVSATGFTIRNLLAAQITYRYVAIGV